MQWTYQRAHMAFMWADLKSAKRYRQLNWIFMLLGSTCVNAMRINVDEIDTWCLFDLWSSQKLIKYDIKSHFLGYFEKLKPYTYEEKVSYFICYEVFTLLSHRVLYPSMYKLWSIFLWNFQSIKFETLNQCIILYQIWLTRAMHRALHIWVSILMSCSKSFIILISELLMQLMNQTQWTSQ